MTVIGTLEDQLPFLQNAINLNISELETIKIRYDLVSNQKFLMLYSGPEPLGCSQTTYTLNLSPKELILAEQAIKSGKRIKATGQLYSTATSVERINNTGMSVERFEIVD